MAIAPSCLTGRCGPYLMDEVAVFFHDGSSIRGSVAHRSEWPGDAWTIVEADGTINAVQGFEFMRVLGRKAKMGVDVAGGV